MAASCRRLRATSSCTAKRAASRASFPSSRSRGEALQAVHPRLPAAVPERAGVPGRVTAPSCSRRRSGPRRRPQHRAGRDLPIASSRWSIGAGSRRDGRGDGAASSRRRGTRDAAGLTARARDREADPRELAAGSASSSTSASAISRCIGDAHAVGRRGAAHRARELARLAVSSTRSTCSTSRRSDCTRATWTGCSRCCIGCATPATRCSSSSTTRPRSRSPTTWWSSGPASGERGGRIVFAGLAGRTRRGDADGRIPLGRAASIPMPRTPPRRGRAGSPRRARASTTSAASTSRSRSAR